MAPRGRLAGKFIDTHADTPLQMPSPPAVSPANLTRLDAVAPQLTTTSDAGTPSSEYWDLETISFGREAEQEPIINKCKFPWNSES